MSFYIRHKCGREDAKQCFVSRGGWSTKRRGARRFKSLEGAKSVISTKPSGATKLYEFVEITFALRWYRDTKPAADESAGYYVRGASTKTDFTQLRRFATRFPTKAAALAEMEGTCLLDGAFGPKDIVGYRVVRITRRVRT